MYHILKLSEFGGDMLANPVKMLKWLLDGSLFLVKGIILLIIAFFINFLVSKFVYIPQHADIFSLIEVLFAVIVTALSIVSSFAIATQWRNLDRNVDAIEESIRTMQNFEKKAESLFTELKASIATLTADSEQNRKGVEALKASSDQANKNIEVIKAGSESNRKSIDALKINTETSIADLKTIAEQSKIDIGDIKTSLATIVATITGKPTP